MRRPSISRFILAVLGPRYGLLDGVYKLGLWREQVVNRSNDVTILDFDYAHRSVLYEYVHSNVIGDAPIDYLEFGVFKGESITSWASINQNSESRFFGFDCFEGLPEDFRAGELRGAFNVDGALPEINDSRINFVKGLFQDTLPDFMDRFKPKHQLVIHLDADLYSSTLFILMHLYKILKPGSILVFDEFEKLHEFSAFHDFTRSCNRDWEFICARSSWDKLAIKLC